MNTHNNGNNDRSAGPSPGNWYEAGKHEADDDETADAATSEAIRLAEIERRARIARMIAGDERDAIRKPELALRIFLGLLIMAALAFGGFLITTLWSAFK